jgi:Mrr N-terminal domain
MKVRALESLKLPLQRDVEAELLKLLAARSQPSVITEVYRTLADTFRLTLVQRQAPRGAAFRSSFEPAWNWLVRRAMQRLQKEGWACRPQYGFWAATEKGRGQAKIAVEGLPDIFADEI